MKSSFFFKYLTLHIFDRDLNFKLCELQQQNDSLDRLYLFINIAFESIR